MEEVVSDEDDEHAFGVDGRRRQQQDVDLIHDDDGGGSGSGVVDDWADTREGGGGRRGGGRDGAIGGGAGGGDGGVVDYDDQLLGEECCGDAASRGAEAGIHRPSPGGGTDGNPSVQTVADATTNSAADGSSARPQPEHARQHEGSRTRVDSTAGNDDATAVDGVAVSPATAHPRRASPDASAAPAATAAGETPRGRKLVHGQRHQQSQQQQPQQGKQPLPPQEEPNKDPSPPPRTPVRPPRAMFSASSFGRGVGAPSSSSTAAASATGGKWRPSFGGGGGGRQSPAGAMHAPWAAFSTPSRDRDGAVMTPSGSTGAGTMGSASARRRRGGGAGNGPLGRLLQQVCTVLLLFCGCRTLPPLFSATCRSSIYVPLPLLLFFLFGSRFQAPS